MGRKVAVAWHASFCVLSAAIYVAFVLPRWWELMGDTSHTLGTVLRIVTGALIGLAALPVVFTLLSSRRPEFGTPQLALTLRTGSIVLHVLAGALIIGTAISEIWLSLDDAGQWLFGIYGAAAAIALLGIFAFYLANVAELPPPPPKPLKPKSQKRGRRGKEAEEAEESEDDALTDETDETVEPEDAEDTEDEVEDTPAEVTAQAEEPDSTADEAESGDDKTNGKLRNRRPETSRRRRRRLRGGVAVED